MPDVRQEVRDWLEEDREKMRSVGEPTATDAAVEGCCRVAGDIADLLEGVKYAAFAHVDGSASLVLRVRERRVDFIMPAKQDIVRIHIQGDGLNEWDCLGLIINKCKDQTRRWARWVRGDE